MPKYGSGATAPKAAASSDKSGTKSKGKVNGVGMGQADGTGRSNGSKERGEYNTGRSESTCYTHKKG